VPLPPGPGNWTVDYSNDDTALEAGYLGAGPPGAVAWRMRAVSDTFNTVEISVFFELAEQPQCAPVPPTADSWQCAVQVQYAGGVLTAYSATKEVDI